RLGMSAHMRSQDPTFTGMMVGLKRLDTPKYEVEFVAVPAGEVANNVKNVPAEWILPNYQGVTQEALDYMRPLVEGQPVIEYENGLPKYTTPYQYR
ncbi:MAG: phosphofructokinase, partial [Erysipelotrichales bacterium]|nr:phosphofructokinase [Erysipelotrichales bacterium]